MGETKKLISITQPDFFPWLGSIYKLVNVEEFVFLDHVRNRVSDGIWTKRVKIIQDKQPKWLSIPLKKIKGVEFVPINQMQIADDIDFASKHLKTIENNYKKAPFFVEVMPLIERWYSLSTKLIAERNIDFLLNLLSAWNIHVNYTFSSKLDFSSSSNELLIEIIKHVGGNEYLFGLGSISYLKPQLFEDANIRLVPQDYNHPTYNQINTEEFIPGLSCIDSLMNCGIKETKHLVCGENNSPR